MKPIFSIKRNINIPSIYCNTNCCNAISLRKKFLLPIKHIYYSYIILLIFITNQISYSQESILQYNGTTIITALRNDTIWIGADSKYGSIGFNAPDSLNNPGIMCKIIKTQ